MDMKLDGVTVRPVKQVTDDQEFCEVFLDDVNMPAESLLGDRGAGWGVAMSVLTDERGSSGAAGLISLERRLHELRALAGADPVHRHRLVELLVRGQALRALMMRSADDPTAASAVKLLRTELEFDAQVLATLLRGTKSVLAGPETDAFLYAPGMRIAGGTSEIQRNIIGERVLGLPKGP